MLQVEVEGKGRGIIAARPFYHGDYLCQYAGETISYQEAKKREKAYMQDNIGCYMFYFNHKSAKLWWVWSDLLRL